ncbi:endonuclease I [uncultured Caudovirales phage]|uniref:Endonuclease I n=1 Tax=uncultured Caudovirales phage TaxID=2100421 RepID=A0A6J5KQ52_9CAUD|nr:endonuclease I [uncultured Caudovirales phage]CAB5220598.1 endonuclease I [uncultured Caudovirales phage]
MPNEVNKGMKYGYRSGLEEKIATQLKDLGIEVGYETTKIKYRVEKDCVYNADWQLPNGIIVESKGYFNTADRVKHLLIKKQHPNLDIRFVFSSAKNKIRKGSKTSYGDWATKHGFKYADKLIPEEWLNE